jgi:hypothetical protein
LPLYGAALDELSFGVQIIKNLLVRLWPIVASSRFVVDAVVAPFCSHNLVGDGQFPGKGKLADRCLAVFARLDDCTLHCFDTMPMVILIARDVPRGATRLRCEAESASRFVAFKFNYRLENISTQLQRSFCCVTRSTVFLLAQCRQTTTSYVYISFPRLLVQSKPLLVDKSSHLALMASSVYEILES